MIPYKRAAMIHRHAGRARPHGAFRAPLMARGAAWLTGGRDPQVMSGILKAAPLALALWIGVALIVSLIV